MDKAVVDGLYRLFLERRGGIREYLDTHLAGINAVQEMSLDMSDPTTANANGVKPSDKDTGITWIKELGMGRVFYCSLGHNDLVFWHKTILAHYLRGIQFAAGDFNVEMHP